jgi:hypothetical protein
MYGYGEEGGYGDGRDFPCWRSRRADDILHMQEWWLVPVTVGMCRQCLGPLGTIGAPAPVGLRQLGCDVRRAWRLASKDAVATAVLFELSLRVVATAFELSLRSSSHWSRAEEL